MNEIEGKIGIDDITYILIPFCVYMETVYVLLSPVNTRTFKPVDNVMNLLKFI